MEATMLRKTSPARFGALLLLLWTFAGSVTTAFRPPFRAESSSSPVVRPSLSLSAQRGGGILPPPGVRFRCGRPDDETIIALTMARELMNPLGISSRNFVVAEDVTTGDRLGWAQIRPLGPSGVDPSELNSRPGSIPSSTVEESVDEMMWDEFEEDPDADFSGGWRSTLPWSKEYKAAMEASARRRERRAELLAKEKANKQKSPSPLLWELASVYVVPDRRSQGIGRSLVKSVLDQHKDFGRSKESIYALTLSSTVDWYTANFGFVAIDDPRNVPKPMALEVAAGMAITKLMGNRLVCLRLPLEMMVDA